MQDTNLKPTDKAVWFCKIGEVDRNLLPNGCDAPLRRAVDDAFFRLTGQCPDFIFSGWDGALTEEERFVADWKMP